MQLLYFPYLTLKAVDEIQFTDLNAKVWNFDRKAAEYIPDVNLRNHIQRILKMHVRGRHAIRDIGILSIGDIDFRRFSQQEIDTAQEVRLRLFLAFSASNNTTEAKR